MTASSSPQGSQGGYIAYDPQEDTETASASPHPWSASPRYIAYDPQEDTETRSHAVLAGMLSALHRLRSARGY